ncbi:MAG: AMP-binding protein, partial [Polyangiales bacterium]
MSSLFPRLVVPDDRLALRIDGDSWSYRDLAGAASAHADAICAAGVPSEGRVAVWAYPTLTTAAAVLGNMAAGAVTVLLSPKLGEGELAHILRDAAPYLAFGDASAPPPRSVAALRTVTAQYPGGLAASSTVEVDDTPALILYTSGTTGAPKGAVITRRNIATNLDALASVWEWTERDTVVHALPLIHVHGLVLGLFGSLRVGGALHHVPRFAPDAIAAALGESTHDRTMLFAVPTMIHRLADAAEVDTKIADALRSPRLLISGSAGLPVREHERIRAITGRGVHERYGLTETLINCAIPASDPPAPGYVGPALPGVELKLVDDLRVPIQARDDETIGEVAVRSDSVFAGYLNRDDATAAVLDEAGWFYTGDLATRRQDGSIRVLGRRSTDLIKTGGYRVGAGEIEACLLEHPACVEVAVVGVPDEDLGQRIVAFVVIRPGSDSVDAPSLDDFV